MIEREAVGIVGLDHTMEPIAIPAWKLAPALAFGNAVVMKPAELTPGCAWGIAKILDEAGCPAGIFNLVMGPGSQVGARIVDHPDIAAVSFTGSVATGRQVAVRCAELGKKVQMEMGGKNPMVVVDDADLDVAVGASPNGAFFSTGQRCTASSRLIVTAGIHDAFLDKLTAAAADLVVGDPLDNKTQIGPVVDQGQLDQNLKYLALASEEGCDVRGGGLGNGNGFFMHPAVFAGASNSMRVHVKKSLGQWLRSSRSATMTKRWQLPMILNSVCLPAFVPALLKYATDFRRNSKAGMVMVNLPTAGVDYHVPFGGRKGSSYGPRGTGQLRA